MTETVELDVLIVGAGISGIDVAYRVQTELPDLSYTILEARNSIGGTWDFFRYPGIRSDSDLYSFGYPWRPWADNKAIADGDSILSYIKASAAQYDIDKKIKFNHCLKSANWSSTERRWTFEVDVKGERRVYKSKFIFLSTGYYDYKSPQDIDIPGLDTFMGDVVHPQFWPQDLSYADKKVIIIGSGATAITLLPTMAPTAQKVTMLQRSPSYVMPLQVAASGGWIRKVAPRQYVDTLIRWKHILIAMIFYHVCKNFPGVVRQLLKRLTTSFLPKDVSYDPHFNPSYKPWEQRICFCPDGDFFKALHRDNTEIVTDTIQTVNEKGILTSSGKFIEADIIITATGLRVQVAGGARVTVDGTQVSFGEKHLWNGAMLQDVPNAAYVIGYGNISWTLGADSTALLVTRLMKEMKKKDIEVAIPRLDVDHGMKSSAMFNIKANYILKAKDVIPQAGDKAPWHARDNAIRDIWQAKYGDVTQNMEFLYKDEEGERLNK